MDKAKSDLGLIVIANQKILIGALMNWDNDDGMIGRPPGIGEIWPYVGHYSMESILGDVKP